MEKRGEIGAKIKSIPLRNVRKIKTRNCFVSQGLPGSRLISEAKLDLLVLDLLVLDLHVCPHKTLLFGKRSISF